MDVVDMWLSVPTFFHETRPTRREIPVQERKNGCYYRPISFVRQQQTIRRDPRLQNRNNEDKQQDLFSGPVKLANSAEHTNGLPKLSAARRKSMSMERPALSSAEGFSSDESTEYASAHSHSTETRAKVASRPPAAAADGKNDSAKCGPSLSCKPFHQMCSSPLHPNVWDIN